MSLIILTDEQKVTLSIQPKTAAGNPATLDGNPQWSTSNSAVLELTPSEDGLSCVATTTGTLGTAQVQVTADADLGEGVRQLTSVLDIEVKAAEAVSLDIAAGTPENR